MGDRPSCASCRWSMHEPYVGLQYFLGLVWDLSSVLHVREADVRRLGLCVMPQLPLLSEAWVWPEQLHQNSNWTFGGIWEKYLREWSFTRSIFRRIRQHFRVQPAGCEVHHRPHWRGHRGQQHTQQHRVPGQEAGWRVCLFLVCTYFLNCKCLQVLKRIRSLLCCIPSTSLGYLCLSWPEHLGSWFLVCNIVSTKLDEIWKTTSIFLKMEDNLNFY